MMWVEGGEATFRGPKGADGSASQGLIPARAKAFWNSPGRPHTCGAWPKESESDRGRTNMNLKGHIAICFAGALIASACGTSTLETKSDGHRHVYETQALEASSERLRQLDNERRSLESLLLSQKKLAEELTIRDLIDASDAVASAELDAVTDELQQTQRAISENVAESESIISHMIDDVDRPEATQRAALYAFAYEMRRALGPTYFESGRWTEFDPDVVHSEPTCPDIVTRETLFSMTEGALRNELPVYVQGLSEVALSIACGSTIDARAISAAANLAYRESIVRFPKAVRQAARRALLSSHANLLLVIADATKFTGDSTLLNLIREERAALREVFAEPASPLRRTGLWLHDRSVNRLVQMRNLCEEGASSPCVSGAAIVDALVDPLRLGFGNCGATEMITPHLDPALGYVCQKNVCNDSGEFAPVGIQRLSARRTTQFGLDVRALRDARGCDSASPGSSGSGTSWEGEGGGMGGVGGALPSSSVDCMTSELLADGTTHEMFSCAADALAASTSDGAAFYGRGGACTRASGGKEPPDTVPEEELTEAEKAALAEAKKKAQEKLEGATDSTQERDNIKHHTGKDVRDGDVAHGQKAIGEKVRIVETEAELQDWCGEGSEACVKGAGQAGSLSATIWISRASLGDVDELVDTLAHEGAHVMIGASGLSASEGGSNIKHHQAMACHMGIKGKCLEGEGANHHQLCDPGIDGCLGGCSPDSNVAQVLSSCFAGSEPTDFRVGCDPTVCDVVPHDDPAGGTWSSCFDSGLMENGNSLSTSCAAAMCADNGDVAQVSGEACGCGPREGLLSGRPSQLDECEAYSYCSGGDFSVSSPSGCHCQSPGVDTFSPPLPPPTEPVERGELYGSDECTSLSSCLL